MRPRAAANAASGGQESIGTTPGDPRRDLYIQAYEEIERGLLERDTVPRALVSIQPQTRTVGGLTITVSPARVEDEQWNSWPDGTARLFNDSIGYLWHVELHSDQATRWSPPHTQLAVNDTDHTFFALVAPDEALEPLRRGAALENELGVAANLGLRFRRADDFRHAYLGTDPRPGDRDGVILFRAPSRHLQAVAMELTLGVWVDGEGVQQHRFLFE